MKLWEYKKLHGLKNGIISNLSILIYHSDFESLVLQRKNNKWEYDRFIFFGKEAYDVVHLIMSEDDVIKLLQNDKYDNATVRVKPININLVTKLRYMVRNYGK